MAHRKTAIAVPAEILDEVDRAARARGESRSRFITRVLRLAVRARRDADVTRRLDALFADESLAEEQRREADDLARHAVAWANERWGSARAKSTGCGLPGRGRTPADGARRSSSSTSDSTAAPSGLPWSRPPR